MSDFRVPPTIATACGINPSVHMRGSGMTTEQMKNAPQNAVFVWCNNVLHYPKSLARDLGRDDLEIVPPHWLDDGERARGRRDLDVVYDHSFRGKGRRQFAGMEVVRYLKRRKEI